MNILILVLLSVNNEKEFKIDFMRYPVCSNDSFSNGFLQLAMDFCLNHYNRFIYTH